MKRKTSPGTVFMLVLTVVVLAAAAIVWTRLSSGATVDLSRLKTAALPLKDPPAETERITDRNPEITNSAAATVSPKETATPEPETKKMTVSFTGTVTFDGEVRKNCYSLDAKAFDYYDIMLPLGRELKADLNIFFLESILSETEKASDIIADASAAAMLKAAGFDMAACGFGKAYEKEGAGIRETRRILEEAGIQSIGTFETEQEERFRIVSRNGVRIAFLQYTDTVPANRRKSMTKQGTGFAVPAPEEETLAEDISKARAMGSNAVIVLMNWGKTGKTPDKTMQTIAMKAAEAGADLIVGNGSRIVSGAETLTTQDDRKVLCVWSLGAALSGDRSNIRRLAGMMFEVTVLTDHGRTAIPDFRFIPLYTWKFKQDGRFYYRCLPAGGPVPDGMDAEQQKAMKRAAESVREYMKNTPAEERSVE